MVISVINNKGGTGKTTTSLNLSATLTNMGYRVLLIDLDSQSSATVALGRGDDNKSTIADILFCGLPASGAVCSSSENFDFIPGSIRLADADLVFADCPDRCNIFRNILSTIRDDYDYIICDCPPSLSTVFVNSLVASDFFIVPVTPEYLALQGFSNLMRTVNLVKKNVNNDIRLIGVLLTMVNPRFTRDRKITREIQELIKEEFGDSLFKTKIIRNVMQSEAPYKNKTIINYAPYSTGSREYLSLAKEIVSRIKEN